MLWTFVRLVYSYAILGDLHTMLGNCLLLYVVYAGEHAIRCKYNKEINKEIKDTVNAVKASVGGTKKTTFIYLVTLK